jgi:hypothetical protein
MASPWKPGLEASREFTIVRRGARIAPFQKAPVDIKKKILSTLETTTGTRVPSDTQNARQSAAQATGSVTTTSSRDFYDPGVRPTPSGPVFLREPNDEVSRPTMVDAHGKVYPFGTALSDIGTQEQPAVLYLGGSLETAAEQTGTNVVSFQRSVASQVQDLTELLETRGKGFSGSVDALADTISKELDSGRPVHLMAHQEGAIVLSLALQQLKKRFMIEQGMSTAQAEAKLENVRVETYGGMAPQFPDGPQFVHNVNTADKNVKAMAARALDELSSGRGAVVRTFTDEENVDEAGYFHRRAPWSDALAGSPYARRGFL